MDSAPITAPPAERSDVLVLAREMAAAYQRMAAYYRDQMQMSAGDAAKKAQEPADVTYQSHLADAPPDQVSWAAFASLHTADTEAALALWKRLKDEAGNELETGHRVAKALEWQGTPWERAQFLAVRTAFREEWKPQGGIESALLDAMAVAFTSYLFWTERLHLQAVTDSKTQDAKLKHEGYWLPPRVEAAAALGMSAEMADRFHRMFLRSLRALRDLRRYTPTVLVQNAGQVNVGTQQVNVAGFKGSSGT